MPRLLLLLQSLALALLLTWPAAANISGRALGSVDADGIKHVWNLWWMRQEFWSGTWGLHTDWVGFPGGMALYPIEPLNGIFAVLLPIAPVALSNLLAILHFTLLGVCAAWLGHLVSGSRAGAHTAGALAQCSGFAAYTLHVGVGELRELWWLPLGFACLLRAQETRAWRWFGALGAVLVLSLLSCFYLGFFLGLGVLTHALCTVWTDIRLLPKYVTTAVCATLLALAPFSIFAKTYDPFDDRSTLTFAEWQRTRPLGMYETAAAEPSQLVKWRSGERAGIDRQLLAYTGGRYLGGLTLLLALVGAFAQPKRALPWLAVATLGITLSLGTVLWEGGDFVRWQGSRLRLPLAWLNQYLGYYAEPINFPARFLAIVVVALPAAAAAAARWRWTLVLVPIACADMVAHDLVPWPRETFALPDARGLTVDKSDKGVLNVTPFLRLRVVDPSLLLAHKDAEGRSRAIAAQLVMGRRFDIIPIERMDFWSADGLVWALPLPMMHALTRLRAVTFEQYRRDLWLLQDRGFDKLLLTHGGSTGGIADVMKVLTTLCGEPELARIAIVWKLPGVTATAAEGAAWKADHEAQVAELPKPKMGEQFPKGPNRGK